MCLRMACSLMALWHSGAGRKHLLQIRMALECFRNSSPKPCNCSHAHSAALSCANCSEAASNVTDNSFSETLFAFIIIIAALQQLHLPLPQWTQCAFHKLFPLMSLWPLTRRQFSIFVVLYQCKVILYPIAPPSACCVMSK